MLEIKKSLLWQATTCLNPLVLLVPVVVGTVFLSCGTGPAKELSLQGAWNQEGLEGTEINAITPSSEGLVLATEEGIFTEDGSGFSRAGLEDKSVIDIVLLGGDKMLAGVSSSDFSGGDTTLFKTTDGGASWQPFMGNYGGEDGKHTWVAALAVHPENSQHLFARGGVNVSRSVDGGHTWESVFKDWEWLGSNGSLLKIDSNNPDIIWAGGANAALQPYIVKSEDRGDNWQWLDVFENVETTVRDIVISLTDANEVLIGEAGAVDPANRIRRSTDAGQSWETVHAGPGIRALARSPQDPHIVYASGFNAERTLFVLVSPDFGESWEEITFENSSGGIRVNDLVAVEANGREVLYLGTNQGVYSWRFDE